MPRSRMLVPIQASVKRPRGAPLRRLKTPVCLNQGVCSGCTSCAHTIGNRCFRMSFGSLLNNILITCERLVPYVWIELEWILNDFQIMSESWSKDWSNMFEQLSTRLLGGVWMTFERLGLRLDVVWMTVAQLLNYWWMTCERLLNDFWTTVEKGLTDHSMVFWRNVKCVLYDCWIHVDWLLRDVWITPESLLDPCE